MTFLELQKQIIQTRKGRRNFDDYQEERFYNAVYKKALHAANKTVAHYFEEGVITPKDKVTVQFKDFHEEDD